MKQSHRREPLSTVPSPMRLGFQVLGRVAPPVAAAMALRLFATPPPPRTANEPGPLVGVPLDVSFGGQRIWTRRWGHGPAVLLAHGWGGRGLQLGPFIEPLVARNLSVVAFDAPAHGRSAGQTTNVREFVETFEAVATAAGDVRGVIAHSLGACAAALSLTAAPRPLRAVFVAPIITLADVFDRFMDRVPLPPRLQATMRDRAEQRYRIRWSELEVLPRAPRATTPLLVIHDRDDRSAAFAGGEELARLWPGARLMATDALGHNRILAAPPVVEAAVAFLDPS